MLHANKTGTASAAISQSLFTTAIGANLRTNRIDYITQPMRARRQGVTQPFAPIASRTGPTMSALSRSSGTTAYYGTPFSSIQPASRWNTNSQLKSSFTANELGAKVANFTGQDAVNGQLLDSSRAIGPYAVNN